MDFMFLNPEAEGVLEFDAREEIVKKDRFFESAQRYIVCDKETLLHRQELFADVLKNDALATFLCALSEKLTEYEPLVSYHLKAANREERVRNILFPTVYIELVSFIYNSLEPIMASVKSEAIKYLFALAKEDIESKEYSRIQKYYEKNHGKLNAIRSVTVGVNLDALYGPKEAGVLAFNAEEFKSGDLLDRILRLDFSKDDFRCVAPLTIHDEKNPLQKKWEEEQLAMKGFHTIAPLTLFDKKLSFQESQQINYAILKAMGHAIDGSLTHCSNRLLNFTQRKLMSYMKLQSSLAFVASAIKRIKLLKDKHIPLCFPKISEDSTYDFVSLYDDNLARIKEKKEVVPNTVTLENSVCAYIVAGPNSGGKTVFLNSVGSAQYYFQLGMPVPARSATMPICDAIYKVSVEKQKASNSAGRFEQECITLSNILKSATKNSLVLIDEAFTSTSSSAAVPIAANFISELCKIGAKCIFVTHYHQLCETEPKIAACGTRVDYLHATINGENRVYFIQKGKAEPNSYAQGIAKKYGLL